MKATDHHMIIDLCKDERVEDMGRNINRVYVAQFIPIPLRLSDELEEKIAKAWAEEVTAATSSGKPAPFSNPFVQCLGYKVDNRIDEKADFGFMFGLTDWTHYSMIKKVDPKTKIWTLGTTAITYFVNGDGERIYIFATRDHTKVAHVGGKIEAPPGGFLDVSLVQSTDPEKVFRANTEKEFEEELGLPKERIRSCRPVEI